MIVLKYKRKKSITQMQITDYLYKVKKRIFVMSIAKDYRTAMKLIHSVPRTPKRKRGRKKDLAKLFYKIDHFIKKGELTKIKPRYLRRFRDVAVVSASAITYEGISRVEKLMLKALPGFTGFFEHIITCNNFTYFDDLQAHLEAKGISFRNRFLHDIIIFELSRIHIGIDNYTAYMNAIRYFQANYLISVLHDPTYFPEASLVSHALRMVPLKALKQFFFDLLEESYEYKIAKNRILIWDGQFVHSNSSDQFNEEKGSYNDPDAGFCRHQGRMYGVGYKVSTIYAYCGSRSVPIYCELFPGNTDEYTVFKETFEHFFSLGLEKPLIILADAGPYSIEILQWLFEMGIVPLINSKKSIKHQNIEKLTDHFYVNMDYIPSHWTKKDLILMMNLRTEIERQFSHIIVVYHARRANVRGLEMVSKHRYLILILDLLKINTAYKMGRPDMIGKARSFTMTKGIDFYSIFPEVAKQDGFRILLPDYSRTPTFFRMG
ncbi:MAG: IS4/IS5 family transposase [Promethearchaeota archaeon]|nr:MAG: IS4/IS5 family transposase [Candidatus Lokiarchaeota archaeon]